MNYRLPAAAMLACALALSLAACTTVGPDYRARDATTLAGEQWLEPADPAPIDPRWWDTFGDPVLSDLVGRLLIDNPDLAEASARLRQARANRAATLGRALPEAEASGSATTNRLSENGQLPVSRIPGFSPEFELFDIGFDASWEIDFWGRRTREAQAANARVEAAEEARRDAIVQLTGELARTYTDLRAAQADLSNAAATAAATMELARLNGLRYRAGESSRIEFDEARAVAARAEEAIPQARTRAARAAYSIAALIGDRPEEVVPSLLAPAPVPRAPDAILVGLRSDLIARRPDVRRAERELAAEVADIGMVTADLYPRFSLLGSLGLQARSVDGLFDSDSLRYSIGPGFSWPIFSGGRIRARISAADAEADQAAARFDKAVIGALADTEGAINRFLNAGERAWQASKSLVEEDSALALTVRRFEEGEDDRLAVERQRLARIDAQRRLDIADAERTFAAAALYKALGGAWQGVGENALADADAVPDSAQPRGEP